MKPGHALIAIYCSLLIMTFPPVAGAQTANFAGTWVLNKAKSTLEARMWEKVETIALEIRHEGDEISITSTMKSEFGESSSSVEFTIGGDYVRKPGMGGSEVLIHGYWEDNGRRLIVETTSPIRAADGSTIETKITDAYTLARLGTVLNLKREILTPNGASISILVFDAE